jgi:hypothetical protein
MTLVSFAGIASKNPLINGQVVERQPDRVIIHARSKTQPEDLHRLALIIKANGEIGPAMANEVSLRLQTGLGCSQYLAGLRQSARDNGPSAQVAKMVKEILASGSG